jgi:hypothetical protein
MNKNPRRVFTILVFMMQPMQLGASRSELIKAGTRTSNLSHSKPFMIEIIPKKVAGIKSAQPSFL